MWFFLSQMLCRDSSSFPSIHRSFGPFAFLTDEHPSYPLSNCSRIYSSHTGNDAGVSRIHV